MLWGPLELPMKPFPAALVLTFPLALAMGCRKPDMDYSKIRLGMNPKEIIARIGEPTRRTASNNIEIFEYEAYDRYGALIVNRRSQYVRFLDGRAEFFGNKADMDATPPAPRRAEATPDMGVGPTTPAPRAFDLRTELEKLEQLKKDGLITEAEFKELRQRVLEKAKS